MTKSDSYIMEVERYLLKTIGSARTVGVLTPLTWYINTGRASTAFLNAMYTKKPYQIARVLMKGGSVEEAITRLRDYLDGKPYRYSEAQNRSTQKYQEEHYARIALSVPKERKEVYAQYAKSQGMSLAGWIKSVLDREVG